MSKWLVYEASRALRSPIGEAEFKVASALLLLANKHGTAHVGLKRLSALCHVHRTTLRRVLQRMSSGEPFAAHVQNERADDDSWRPVTYELSLEIEEPETWSGADVARNYRLRYRKTKGRISRVDPRVHGVQTPSPDDDDSAENTPHNGYSGQGPLETNDLDAVDPEGVQEAPSRGSSEPPFDISLSLNEERKEVSTDLGVQSILDEAGWRTDGRLSFDQARMLVARWRSVRSRVIAVLGTDIVTRYQQIPAERSWMELTHIYRERVSSMLAEELSPQDLAGLSDKDRNAMVDSILAQRRNWSYQVDGQEEASCDA